MMFTETDNGDGTTTVAIMNKVGDVVVYRRPSDGWFPQLRCVECGFGPLKHHEDCESGSRYFHPVIEGTAS